MVDCPVVLDHCDCNKRIFEIIAKEFGEFLFYLRGSQADNLYVSFSRQGNISVRPHGQCSGDILVVRELNLDNVSNSEMVLSRVRLWTVMIYDFKHIPGAQKIFMLHLGIRDVVDGILCNHHFRQSRA